MNNPLMKICRTCIENFGWPNCENDKKVSRRTRLNKVKKEFLRKNQEIKKR